MIEKHFTLDKALPGPDHKASLSPEELTAMVAAVRKTELALGDGRKHVTESEAKNKPIARKSILAKRDIKKGELINKYGEEIGIATKDIKKGEYVHVHNLDSMRGRGDWAKEGK